MMVEEAPEKRRYNYIDESAGVNMSIFLYLEDAANFIAESKSKPDLLLIQRDLCPETKNIISSCSGSKAIFCGASEGITVPADPITLRPVKNARQSWKNGCYLYAFHLLDGQVEESFARAYQAGLASSRHEGQPLLFSMDFWYPGFSEATIEPMPLFEQYFLRPTSKKLYVLVAPSAFGKSSLSEELQIYGVKQLPKLTTREYRSSKDRQSIISVSPAELAFHEKMKNVLAGHTYNKNFYGLRREDLSLIFSDNHEAYVWDTCDFEAANKLREQFPEFVKLVGVFPELSFAGFGLEQRIKAIDEPSEQFSSMQDELEALKKAEATKVQTKNRLEGILREAKEFQKYLPDLDFVLRGTRVSDNVTEMIKIITEDKK